ncbi:uncharacterized protein LOC144422830 [Styela clava]
MEKWNYLPKISQKRNSFIQLHLYLHLKEFDDNYKKDNDACIVCLLECGEREEVVYEKRNYFYYATTKIPADTKKLRYSIVIRYSQLSVEKLYCGERIGAREQEIQKGFAHVATFDVMNRQLHDQQQQSFIWGNALKAELPQFLLDNEDSFPWRQKLRSWRYQIDIGWTTQDIHNVKISSKNISEIYAVALQYVEGNTTSEKISNMITFIAMTFPNLEIRNDKFNIICRSLAMYDLTQNKQSDLNKQIWQEAKDCGYDKELNKVISCIFDEILQSNRSDWILALPFYWLIINEKNKPSTFTFDDSDCGNELPQKMRENWAIIFRNMEGEDSQRSLKNIFKDILNLSRLHPWIARPYFRLMECRAMMTLLSEHQNVLFDPKIIVSILSSHLKVEKLKLKDMLAMDEYFSEFAYDVCKSRIKEPQYIAFVVENIVQATEKEDFSWKVLIWTMKFLSECVNASSDCKSLQDGGQVIKFAKAVETMIQNIDISTKFSWKDFLGINVTQLIQIFECEWQSEAVQKTWLIKISKALKDKIKEFEFMGSSYLEAYSTLPDIPNENLKKVLDKAAYHFFKTLFKCKDLFGYGWLNSQWQLKNLTEFSEKFFQNESELFKYKYATNEQEKQLEFVLNWEHSAKFYHHICKLSFFS